jgi:hypothetical protein
LKNPEPGQQAHRHPRIYNLSGPIARKYSKPVKPERLGFVGQMAFGCAYARTSGTAKFGSTAPFAEVPFVIVITGISAAMPRRDRDDDDDPRFAGGFESEIIRYGK